MILFFEFIYHFINNSIGIDHKLFLAAVILEIILIMFALVYKKALNRRGECIIQDHYCVTAFIMSFMDALYFLNLIFENNISHLYKISFISVELLTLLFLFMKSKGNIIKTLATFFTYRAITIILIPLIGICNPVIFQLCNNHFLSVVITACLLYMIFYYWQSKTQRKAIAQNHIRVLHKKYLFLMFICGIISGVTFNFADYLDIVALRYLCYAFLIIFILIALCSLCKNIKQLRLLAFPVMLFRIFSYLCIFVTDATIFIFMHEIISGNSDAEKIASDGISIILYIFLGILGAVLIYFWFTLSNQEKSFFLGVYFLGRSANAYNNYLKTGDVDSYLDSVSYDTIANQLFK